MFAFASILAAGSCRLVFTSKIDFKHESCLMLPAAMTYAIPGLLLCYCAGCLCCSTELDTSMQQENHFVHCTFDTFVESGAVELISASHVILFKTNLQLYFLSFLCCFKVFDIVYIT